MITGITGQDGAYLAKILLEKGYRVIGVVRPSSQLNKTGLDYLGITNSIELYPLDLLHPDKVNLAVKELFPNEIYHLAAQSSVGLSFQDPAATIHFNLTSTINLLESIKQLNRDNIKFYQASSSEMFGHVDTLPITEITRIHPLSPYAISKAAAHWTTINYRESWGLFACCGILFNHESYLRRPNFFIKKILRESIRITRGEQDILRVGNIDIRRDFGYGPRYVEAMFAMLQQPTANDFIICSGQSISLRDIITWLFDYLNIDINKLVIDQQLYRPNEITNIYGCNQKAKLALQWDYSLNFLDVMKMLVEEELANQ